MNDHSYTPRQSPGDATALVSVSPLTAADAFAEIRANTSLSPIRKRDETSALTALVRMCRPVDAGTLTASTIDRVARLVVLVSVPKALESLESLVIRFCIPDSQELSHVDRREPRSL
jgi:hypothetical protein